ncbi:MAG: ABC transporter substrate-binding protein [Burkholderiales bacterium]|nr:ABC transporter substrate-binding protein [Burkholderiales bacterium]
MLTDAIGKLHMPVAAADARIVSLVPSLTELVYALGLDAQLIGRTGFCVHPAPHIKRVPKVGGTKTVNLDKIRRLAPTHVLVNIDENEKPTVEQIAEFVPNIVVTHPCRVRDNLALYQLLGQTFSVTAAAQQLCTQFEEAWQQLPQGHNQKTVLYCIWREPWMTVGTDTYLADMLSLINWQVWQPSSDSVLPRYPVFDWQDPRLAEVELVLLSTEPYRFNASHVAELQAQIGKPVLLVDGEMLSWFGSRAIAGLGYLRQLALAA